MSATAISLELAVLLQDVAGSESRPYHSERRPYQR